MYDWVFSLAEVTPKPGSVIRVVLQDGDAFSISHAISIAHDTQATMATTRLRSGSEFARAISSPYANGTSAPSSPLLLGVIGCELEMQGIRSNCSTYTDDPFYPHFFGVYLRYHISIGRGTSIQLVARHIKMQFRHLPTLVARSKRLLFLEH